MIVKIETEFKISSRSTDTDTEYEPTTTTNSRQTARVVIPKTFHKKVLIEMYDCSNNCRKDRLLNLQNIAN